MEDLVGELINNKPDDVSDEIIITFVEDIVMCLRKDEEKEYEMNQNHAGMQELFRGYAVID